MNKNVNNISWGLFRYKKPYFWRNIKDIKIFFKRIVFTLKHGYAPQACWETFAWFIDTIKEILSYCRNDRCGSAIVIDNYQGGHESDEENTKAYNDLMDKMIDLLDKMDEESPIYKNMSFREKDDCMLKAKDEFFELFSKCFYMFWD